MAASLLFSDDVVPLASSVGDLQRPLETLTAAGMKVSTSKSQTTVLCQKTVTLGRGVGGFAPPGHGVQVSQGLDHE